MLSDAVIEAAQAAYPDAGTLRLHPRPDQLHPAERDRPGLNRFDDPDGIVSVRYTATRLTGCLRETLARFRPNPDAESRLNEVEGIEDDDVDWSGGDTTAISDWLSQQQVGVVQVTRSGLFLDVENPRLLSHLDKHPRVREAVRALDRGARLDVALVRLGGVKLGRPISQAAGVAVREWAPDALGIGYRSRLVSDEPCWAIWNTTPVEVTAVPLSPRDPQHLDAVRTVAAEFEILLPDEWQ